MRAPAEVVGTVGAAGKALGLDGTDFLPVARPMRLLLLSLKNSRNLA